MPAKKYFTKQALDNARRKDAVRYYHRKREERLEYAANYRKNNPRKVKIATAKWFEENKEYRRIYKAEYRRTHKKTIENYRKKKS